ncbi:MAG: hypothetical protein ACYC1Q_05375 [Bacteroidia bacterium]
MQVQSGFSKGINFFALYSPYELGNNHPDTAFRTFNCTSLLSAGASYSKMWKRALWFSQFILSESSISGENLPLTHVAAKEKNIATFIQNAVTLTIAQIASEI